MYTVRELRRKVVMKHISCMDRDFTAQLCLWTPPCPINLTEFLICKFRYSSNPPITSSITKKVVLTITPLEWLMAMHMIFDRNTGEKTSKFKTKFSIWIKFNFIYFKSFIGVGFYVLHPWSPTANIT